MNIMWQVMVDEWRAERAEADHRRHFTEEKKPVQLIRDQLVGWTEVREAADPEVVVARTATNLHAAAGDDLFEVG